MSSEAVPGRLKVIWAPEAKAELRAIDRTAAIEILHCLDRYLASHQGDTKKLKLPLTGFRLRCADYRLFFKFENEQIIEITSVRHRREAYR